MDPNEKTHAKRGDEERQGRRLGEEREDELSSTLFGEDPGTVDMDREPDEGAGRTLGQAPNQPLVNDNDGM